jgi:hypothetical protein
MIRQLQLKVSVETVRSVQLWVTVGALTVAPLAFGSVDQLWIAVWTVMLSLSTLLAVPTPLGARQAGILLRFLIVCFAYALVAVIQVTPRLLDQFDDPLWREADELLGLNVSPRETTIRALSMAAAFRRTASEMRKLGA